VCACGWDYFGTDYGYRGRGAGFSIFINDIVAQIDFCQLRLNPEKSQAIVIGFPGFHAAAIQLVSMGSTTIPFCTIVKSLRLTISDDDQIDIVCLWTAASLCPVGTRLQLARSLVVPLFLYGDVIFSKVLWGCVTGCDWHIIIVRGISWVFVGLSPEHILGYSSRILVLPLGRYYSLRICYQMNTIVSLSTQKPAFKIIYR
jgi:hypothetical protein